MEIKRALLIAALLAGSAAAQTGKAFSAASNWCTDLAGTPDKRVDTWGNAGQVVWKQKFHPPAGYAVHILKVRGDLIAWPKDPAPPGTDAGVMLALSNGSTRLNPGIDYGDSNTFLYIQDVTHGNGVRAPFSETVSLSPSATLTDDKTLVIKVAVFLNNTGQLIHLEATYVVIYEFVPIEK